MTGGIGRFDKASGNLAAWGAVDLTQGKLTLQSAFIPLRPGSRLAELPGLAASPMVRLKKGSLRRLARPAA